MNRPENAATLARKIAGLYRDAGLLDSGIFATEAQWRELLEQPHQGRIGLVGLYKLNSTRPGDDLSKSGVSDLAGKEYFDAVNPLCEKYGVKDAYYGVTLCNWVGANDLKWDFVSISEFPSVDALAALMSHPDFIRVCDIRVRNLEKHQQIVVQLP